MILDEMEEWTLWIAVVAFGCSLLIEALRRVVSEAPRRLLAEAQPDAIPPDHPSQNVAAPIAPIA